MPGSTLPAAVPRTLATEATQACGDGQDSAEPSEGLMSTSETGRKYWFLRMKYGPKGQDFTREMWEQRLIGVMWGCWSIDDVLADDRETIDRHKLTVDH